MNSALVERHGALSALTPAVTLAALELVQQGEVYDLAVEISERMPQGPRGAFVPFSLVYSTTPELSRRDWPYSFSAETVIGTLHTSTHIDALIHVQHEGRTYGGHEASEIRTDRGWSRYGVETIPPIVTRGVVLDVAGALGVSRLDDGYEITVDDLRTAGAEEIGVRAGDTVLIRTGKIAQYLTEPEAFGASEPGVGVDAATWLFDQGMAVLATDTTGTEPLPFNDVAQTVHRALLIERGVHLVENLFLEEVAAAKVQAGVFVCLPLKICGATGSWVRPILIR